MKHVADTPKKKPVGIASLLLTLLVAMALFVVLRWVLSWIWRVVFFAGCIALAYILLRAIGLIGDDSKG